MRAVRELVGWPRRLARRLLRWREQTHIRRLIAKSGLFDSAWYLAQYPELAAEATDLILHYLRSGARAGVDPNPLFDTDWYLAQNPKVVASGTNPLLHYLRRGASKGRDPHPLFDTDWYLAQNPEVAASNTNPLAHYLCWGASQRRDPNPMFDTGWYFAQNPDVATSGMNPLVHYLLHGATEERDPSPLFSTGSYLAQNPEVAASGVNPLAHYLGRLASTARARCRAISPSFFKLGCRHHLGYVVPANEGGTDSVIANARTVSLDALLPNSQTESVSVGDCLVDVIVPVYDGLEETRICIESVLRSRSQNRSFGRLVLVEDCGPSAELRSYVSQIGQKDTVLLLQNAVNRGFVASVNRAFAKTGPNDVILLNSDTAVCGNWIDRLVVQAYADPRIGTVTPFSNNATICSFPDKRGERHLPAGFSLEQIDAACSKANAMRAVDVPTGVGFCMFIKRTCIDEIGIFDEETFGTGYGEENDFCQRARANGWRNTLAGDVFVFHAGETSFGESSVAKKARALAVMCERYPSYSESVSQWIKSDPALPMRLAAIAALWRSSGRPVILHILHTLGGGAEKHVAKLASDTSVVAHNMVLLARSEDKGVQLLLLLQEQSIWQGVDLSARRLADAAPFFASFGVSQVHVHLFVEVVAEISLFLRSLGVPYELTVHDQCPRQPHK